MLELKYPNSKDFYEVNFSKISENIVELKGKFPIETTGFTLSRPGCNDNWDYSEFMTVYKEVDGGVQYSNDCSVYVEPDPVPGIQPEYTPEPYVPTLEEVKEAKVKQMNAVQQQIIKNGVGVVLADGTTEHFSLDEYDQTNLMGLQAQVAAGQEQIPWHTSNQEEHCKFYSNADMQNIISTAMQHVTWHVTYFRDLRIYIRSLAAKDDVEAVMYGMDIPEEYQSEPLKAMLAAQSI